MTPAEFALKWTGSTQTERAASQEHFIDLCRMLGVPTPNEADPTGRDYASRRARRRSAAPTPTAVTPPAPLHPWHHPRTNRKCRQTDGALRPRQPDDGCSPHDHHRGGRQGSHRPCPHNESWMNAIAFPNTT